jgi:hypothetical protein
MLEYGGVRDGARNDSGHDSLVVTKEEHTQGYKYTCKVAAIISIFTCLSDLGGRRTLASSRAAREYGRAYRWAP